MKNDGTDLTNKYVVIKEEMVNDSHKPLPKRIGLVKGGFGAKGADLPYGGGKTFVEHLDGETVAWYRIDIERLATPEEIAQFVSPNQIKNA